MTAVLMLRLLVSCVFSMSTVLNPNVDHDKWTFTPPHASQNDSILSNAIQAAQSVYVASDDSNNSGLFSLDANNGNVNWTFETNGYTPVLTAPVVYRNTVLFEALSNTAPTTVTLFSVSANNGRLQWKKSFATNTSGIVNSPLVEHGMIFLVTDKGITKKTTEIFAFDTQGKVVWSRTAHGWNGSSPPVYSNGRVYATMANGLNCFDARTGRLIWRNDEGAGQSLLVTHGVLVDNQEFAITEYGLKDGREKWSWNISQGSSVGSTVSGGTLLVATSGGDGDWLYAISTANGSPTGKIKIPGQFPPLFGPNYMFALSHGVVYFTFQHGNLASLDVATHQLNWVSNWFVDSPTVYGSTLYCTSVFPATLHAITISRTDTSL